jgi:hypothetical protein
MSVTPIGWQSPARREAILALLAARADAALAQWARPDALTSSFDHARPAASVESCWMFDARRGAIVVQGPENAFGELGCRLVGLATSDGSGIAENLGRRAFVDVLAAICGVGAGECAVVRHYVPAAEQMEPRRGIVSVRWQIAGLELTLHLDAALCEHVLPRIRAGRANLIARDVAVTATSVDVEAIVGLGSIDALHIADLRPGVVIKTDARLDAPVFLNFGGTERSALNGDLVALGERRAFRRGNTTSHEELT